MQLKTVEQIREQNTSKGTLFLVEDGKSKEMEIISVSWLYESQPDGQIALGNNNDELVEIDISLNKDVEKYLSTEPKEGTEVELLTRIDNPTLEQINEAISTFDDRGDDNFAYALSDSLHFLTTIGDVEFVDDFGGEGMGDHAHVVFKVVSTGKLYKIDGYYSSWEGTDWESEAYEVKPVEVTNIEYQRVK